MNENLRKMANWAATSYRIEGGKSDLEKVYGAIDGFMKKRQRPATQEAAYNWEGNVLQALGATDGQMAENYLRGFIQTYGMEGGILRIEAEEAWGATDFRHVLGKLVPGLAIYFAVKEGGCEVYATNDAEGRYFPGRFFVDACVGGDYQSEYFWTEGEALDYAARLTGRERTDRDELERWNEDHGEEDDFIYVHEVKVVDF